MKKIFLAMMVLAVAIVPQCGTGCKRAAVRDEGKVYAEIKEDDWSKVDQVKAQVLIQNPNVKWVEILRKKEDPDVKEIVGHETDPPNWANDQRKRLSQPAPTPGD
jgi:hypothetical protein